MWGAISYESGGREGRGGEGGGPPQTWAYLSTQSFELPFWLAGEAMTLRWRLHLPL